MLDPGPANRRRRTPDGSGGGGRGGGKGGGGGGGKKGRRKSRSRQHVLNPPFDPRMRAIGNPALNPGKLKRGWIECAPEEYEDMGNPNHRVNFMLNPSELTVAGEVNMNLPTGEAKSDVLEGLPLANLLAQGIQGFTISLLYDRTYEMAGMSRDRTWAQRIGVYADVAAWYHYCKVFGNNDDITRMLGDVVDKGGLSEKLWRQLNIQAPIHPTISHLFIGNKLRYFGWPTGLSVRYSQWTHRMVPVRCSVDVGFTCVTNPEWMRARKESLKGKGKGGGGAYDSIVDSIHDIIPFNIGGGSADPPHISQGGGGITR